ncbi:MAG: hypothetical protein SVP52_05765 [Chloroflexota bacterium]|nr:hypothetical protein [Chloroflexota bacterium]
MTRIIATSTPGKERVQLSKGIVVTIREFMRQDKPDKSTRDMVAFIILALEEIAAGIDKSVAAWEKRGYWVKADKYRLAWQWTGSTAKKMRGSLQNNNWGEIASTLLDIMGKFENIKVSNKHRMGKPWQGAFIEYQKKI